MGGFVLWVCPDTLDRLRAVERAGFRGSGVCVGVRTLSHCQHQFRGSCQCVGSLVS